MTNVGIFCSFLRQYVPHFTIYWLWNNHSLKFVFTNHSLKPISQIPTRFCLSLYMTSSSQNCLPDFCWKKRFASFYETVKVYGCIEKEVFITDNMPYNAMICDKLLWTTPIGASPDLAPDVTPIVYNIYVGCDTMWTSLLSSTHLLYHHFMFYINFITATTTLCLPIRAVLPSKQFLWDIHWYLFSDTYLTGDYVGIMSLLDTIGYDAVLQNMPQLMCSHNISGIYNSI